MFYESIIKILSLTSIEFLTRFAKENVDCKIHNEKSPMKMRLYCRGGQIRTDDLLVPNQARYRATLRPELLKEARRYKNIFNYQLKQCDPGWIRTSNLLLSLPLRFSSPLINQGLGSGLYLHHFRCDAYSLYGTSR
jgi:hypothetical protein